MTEEQQPDLTGELARAEEAAAGGIQIRAAVLEIDADDGALEPGEDAEAPIGDDDEVEDADDEAITADV
jgi:hypothetical protein